ncbi:MAG TPA: hypothetical protein VIF15_04015 [Polyangiaceae bacterium]|jgi:hypothetical protein
MGLFEKDHVVRLLEQLTKRMAAARGLVAGGRPGDALESIQEARRTLAGPLAATLERVDGATVVALVGVERARAYAELSTLEAQARDALGDGAAARRAEARASEVQRALG